MARTAASLLAACSACFVAPVAGGEGVCFGAAEPCEAGALIPKVSLSLGEVHVVDSFFSPAEVAAAVASLEASADQGRLESVPFAGMAALQCPLRGGTRPTSEDAAVRCIEEATDAAGPSALADRVIAYANERLHLKSTLSGAYSYGGTVFPDYSVLRRYPTQRVLETADGKRVASNEGALHVDSDFVGRCLSVVVFLTTSDGGGMNVFSCPTGEERRCQGLQGDVLRGALADGALLDPKRMVLAEAVAPVAGRAAFFLSDTVHAVAPLASQPRDTLLVWMSCMKLGPEHVNWRRLVMPPWQEGPLAPWARDPSSLDKIRSSVTDGQLVRIMGAVSPGIFEALYHDLLDARDWEHEASASPAVQLSRHVLRCGAGRWGLGGCSELLGHFHRFMSASVPFWSSLFGIELGSWSSPAEAAATWYRKGDFISPHTDLERDCAVSLIWYLAAEWRPEQGGSFWWLRPSGAEQFTPDFNTLYLFRAGELTRHLVSPVVSESGRRFAISGCFLSRSV